MSQNNKMERLKKQVDFINELEKLKTIKRQNLTLDNGRWENSAEHSWHCALMALVLNEYAPREVDRTKVMTLLLIHDLVEIYAGDTWVFDDRGREKSAKNEEKAIQKLASLLPEDQGEKLINLWHEFEVQSSAEAGFAKVIDALQPLLSHLCVAPRDYNPNHLTKEQVLEKKIFIKDAAPALWPLVEEIMEKSVEKGSYT